MSKLKLLSIALILFAGTVSQAGIDCRPGMGNCPGPVDPVPQPPGSGTRPSRPVEFVGIGYTEYVSPDCLNEDLEAAKAIAEQNAIKQAQRALKTDGVVLTKPFHYSQRCGIGIYQNSNEEVSWIVQAFGVFKAADSY